MKKVKLVTSVSCCATPIPGVKFSSEFTEKAKMLLRRVADKYGYGEHVLMEMSPERIFVGVQLGTVRPEILNLLRELETELVLLAEHGRDADLLAELLERHPELKTHPRVDRVIGAYENLRNTVEQLKAGVEPCDAHAKHLIDTGVQPTIGSFLAAERRGAVEDKSEHRRKALLGHNPDQQVAEAVVPYIPPYYMNKMREKGIVTDGKDFGNVFG